jgi:hypothetical protein
MTLAERHSADMAAILADAGNTFTFGGADYACIVTDKVDRKPLMADGGGFIEEFDLSIQTRVDLFSTLPTAGQTLTYDGVTRRIVNVRKNYTGKILTLDCMTVNR